jgi:hypothetical protein
MLYSTTMNARRAHRGSRITAVAAVLLLAVAVLVLQGALLPHTHTGTPGLYNEEHDLKFYALSGGAAALTETAPILFVVVLLLAVSIVAVGRAHSLPRAHADSRAPPTR